MERDTGIGTKEIKQPLEIDIRKILEQLGIQMEKWPDEFKKPPQCLS
ncbi:hypothetical protein [Cohnella kolymensis]|nr:hypothetical protein [Cohnella kolymensis]